MSDIICTNCCGQLTAGCWLCNPSMHQALQPAIRCDYDHRWIEYIRANHALVAQSADKAMELESRGYVMIPPKEGE